MRTIYFCALLLAVFRNSASVPVPDDDHSIVVSTTDSTKEQSGKSDDHIEINPQIYSMQINANVSNRFTKTLVTSKVRNVKNTPAETTFSVILPENAFISEFEMEIKEKVYKAYVKEKEEAKNIYQQAVSRGQSAAHVEMSARDSKKFTVSVNIEPESKTIFRLTYEELLKRKLGRYELVLNIHPGQIVDDLGVQVFINESQPLAFVKTPSLRTGNEITKNDDKLKPNSKIDQIDKNSAIVTFTPSKEEQTNFGKNLGVDKENQGLAGQFVVQYDVERNPTGEILVRDGYFVHFFAPSELEPLPQHVVFVFDHSGSMQGGKIEQLIKAMQNILSQLKPTDVFHIVRFADDCFVWNPENNKFSSVSVNSSHYGELEPFLKEANLIEPVEVKPENVEKAKIAINDTSDMGLTNIIFGLEVGLFLLKRQQEKNPNKYQPMLIFLTDGFPNVGMHSSSEIVNTVNKLNSGEHKSAIFSLSFGEGADKGFLKELSSKNHGFSRHIYEASDSALQLEDFYNQISSPLLTNITFKDTEGASDLTKTQHHFLFNGSEIVVAGRIENITTFFPCTIARSENELVEFTPNRSEPVTSLERLWAYLTVKQMLNKEETAKNSSELSKKALDLALKYSFVTPITSLVVVKPNSTDSTNTQSANTQDNSRDARTPYSSRVSSYNFPTTGFQGRSLYVPQSYNSFMRFGGGYSAPMPARSPALIPTTTSLVMSTPIGIISPSNTLPKWLEDLQNTNGTISTPQGTFKLGNISDLAGFTLPPCSNAPNNSTALCTLITECTQMFPLLTDEKEYLQYFCPLKEFAGVCCLPPHPGN